MNTETRPEKGKVVNPMIPVDRSKFDADASVKGIMKRTSKTLDKLGDYE